MLEYDVIFLDISMPEISGLEIARKIREKSTNVLLVFVTSFTVNEGTSIPRTGQVVDMYLRGVTMSNVDRWRLMPENQSFWTNNKGTCNPTVDMNYIENASNNARLPGTWQAAFKATTSATTKTFTPYFSVTYYCEYGDE